MPPLYSRLPFPAFPCYTLLSSAHLSEYVHEVELVCASPESKRGYLAGLMGIINATWPHRDNVLVSQVRAVWAMWAVRGAVQRMAWAVRAPKQTLQWYLRA